MKEAKPIGRGRDEIYVGKGRKIRDDARKYPQRNELTGGFAGGELGLRTFLEQGDIPLLGERSVAQRTAQRIAQRPLGQGLGNGASELRLRLQQSGGTAGAACTAQRGAPPYPLHPPPPLRAWPARRPAPEPAADCHAAGCGGHHRRPGAVRR